MNFYVNEKQFQAGYSIKKNAREAKKVLMLCYYFPPFCSSIEGSGVQRPLKFAQYLPDSGYEPIILTIDRGDSGSYGHELLNNLPDTIKIYRTKPAIRYKNRVKIAAGNNNIKDNNRPNNKFSLFYNLIKKNILSPLYYKFYMRWFLTFPDGQIFWLWPAYKNALNIIIKEKIDLIFTTSAPYTSHLIGYLLKKRTNKSWIVDFRDEWSGNPYKKYASNIHFIINKKLEKKVLMFADKIITVSPCLSEHFRSLINNQNEKITTISNGYDDMNNNNFRIETNFTSSSNKFIITYLGVFYKELRTPKQFLYGIEYLIKNKLIDPEHLQIIFVGDRYKIENSNIQHLIKQTGYLNYEQAREYMVNTTLLLNIEPNSQRTYPGKLFDYISTGKPILSLCSKNSDTANLLQKVELGYIAEPNDIPNIASQIQILYNKWKQNDLEKHPNWYEINKYTRKNLTKQLANVFDKLLHYK